MSVSSFLAALSLNEPIRSLTDLDAVRELMRINGDLGRLGGLLKLWLAERAGHGAKIADVRQSPACPACPACPAGGAAGIALLNCRVAAGHCCATRHQDRRCH
jgi:hypothetical protein